MAESVSDSGDNLAELTDENGNTIEVCCCSDSDSEVEGDNKPFEELPEEDIAMDEDAYWYETKASAFRAM